MCEVVKTEEKKSGEREGRGRVWGVWGADKKDWVEGRNIPAVQYWKQRRGKASLKLRRTQKTGQNEPR